MPHRPLALINRETVGDLSFDAFERKHKKQSVFSDDVTEKLLKSFKKPSEGLSLV